MAEIDSLIANPEISFGILNPDTGELDFQKSLDELMGNRFSESKEDSNAIIDGLNSKIQDLRGHFRDEKNKIIGDHESKKMPMVSDLTTDAIDPKGKSGEVAKRDGQKEIESKREEINKQIEALESELAAARKSKHGNASDHTARRLEQGYVMFMRTGDGWDIVASTFDRFLGPVVLDVIKKMMSSANVHLVVGGKRVAPNQGLDNKGLSNFISQQASLRARSITSSFWAKRKNSVRYDKNELV